jgi:ribosomal protein L39E
MTEEKIEKKVGERKEKPKKTKKREKGSKEIKAQVTAPNPVTMKKPVVRQRQKALMEKKTKLAVKTRQTKWAPVWVVIRKYGMGKRVHPSAATRHRRNWRRTKLHIKPRKIRKWHMG